MAVKKAAHTAATAENTDVGYFIQSVMSKNGWSLRDVAERAAELERPFSYEHLRKIIKGTTTPSVDLLERVAEALGVDPATLTKAQMKTMVTRNFGREYLSALDITPDMYEMDHLMKLLKPDQREKVMTMIRSLVQGNARKGVVSIRRRRS